MISYEQIEEIAGEIAHGGFEVAAAHPSPGLHARHYSPSTPLLLVEDGRLPSAGRGAYLWLFEPSSAAVLRQMPGDAASYAAVLYETLHRMDEMALDWIAVEAPPEWPEWAAIRDRLKRASSRK
jgi:L-threonylcarbamoyladenylate synthase